MDFVQTFILAVVQGVTEFLPISSSAHLILTSQFLNWQDQGTAFDLSLHIGTLLAVILYFRNDVTVLLRDTTLSLVKRQQVGQSRLGWYLAFSTIPAGLFGLLLLDYVDSYLRNPQIIFVTTLCYAILLWLADKVGKKQIQLDKVNLRDAVLIGFAQALALIPGTSRSGATITAALLLGYSREAASRFSFLLAIPITFLATVAKIGDDALSLANIPWGSFILGALLSFITALLAIHYFLKLLNKYGMMPYVIYRLLLAVAIYFYLL